MKLQELEQIVGPINRRHLADGFPSDGISNYAEDKYLSKAGQKPNPPPLIEDLSYLNPHSHKRCQETGRMTWVKLSKRKKLDRINRLKKIGLEGGRSRKKMVVRYSKANENIKAMDA